jgi:hypothetical protein
MMSLPSEHLTIGAEEEQRNLLGRVRESINHHRRAAVAAGVLAVAAVAGVGAFAYEAGNSESAHADISNVSAGEAAQNCEAITDAEAASNAADYNPNAFLPKTGKVEKQEDARVYVSSLFSKDGPLAGQGDYASLAAVVSAVTKPSHDKSAVDPKYNYAEQFNTSLATYRAEGGNGVAEKDCVATFDTLMQVAGYTDSWNGENGVVTQLRAVRNGKNQVVDMDLKKLVNGTTYQGILLKFNNHTAKNVDEFVEVLISTNEGQRKTN